MRIIREPKVYLVGSQSVDEDELKRFLEDEGVPGWKSDAACAGERLVEVAGRICFDSYAKPRPGGNKAYIANILKSGHLSVTEHRLFQVIATGVSRNLAMQMLRHRHISPSELSQRFHDESDASVVMPPAALGDPEAEAAVLNAALAGRAAYRGVVEALERSTPGGDKNRRKKIREAARAALPGATETKLFLTFNARTARHFLRLRGSAEADAEARRLALAIFSLLKPDSPELFADMRVTEAGTIEVLHPEIS